MSFRLFLHDVLAVPEPTKAVYVHSEDGLEYCFFVVNGVSTQEMAYVYDTTTREEVSCVPKKELKDLLRSE